MLSATALPSAQARSTKSTAPCLSFHPPNHHALQGKDLAEADEQLATAVDDLLDLDPRIDGLPRIARALQMALSDALHGPEGESFRHDVLKVTRPRTRAVIIDASSRAAHSSIPDPLLAAFESLSDEGALLTLRPIVIARCNRPSIVLGIKCPTSSLPFRSARL